MQSMSLEEAEGHLAEIIGKLSPGQEVLLTRDEKPVAAIRLTPTSKTPRFGTLKGSILYIAPDFDVTPEGFEEYVL